MQFTQKNFLSILNSRGKERQKDGTDRIRQVKIGCGKGNMEMTFVKTIMDGDAAAHSRAVYKGSGYTPEELGRKPHIGIANTFSENSAGHAHLRRLAEAVKQGIWQAGGTPFGQL